MFYRKKLIYRKNARPVPVPSRGVPLHAQASGRPNRLITMTNTNKCKQILSDMIKNGSDVVSPEEVDHWTEEEMEWFLANYEPTCMYKEVKDDLL